MSGRVWPWNFVWACLGRFYFYQDWPLVALNPYRYAVYVGTEIRTVDFRLN